MRHSYTILSLPSILIFSCLYTLVSSPRRHSRPLQKPKNATQKPRSTIQQPTGPIQTPMLRRFRKGRFRNENGATQKATEKRFGKQHVRFRNQNFRHPNVALQEINPATPSEHCVSLGCILSIVYRKSTPANPLWTTHCVHHTPFWSIMSMAKISSASDQSWACFCFHLFSIDDVLISEEANWFPQIVNMLRFGDWMGSSAASTHGIFTLQICTVYINVYRSLRQKINCTMHTCQKNTAFMDVYGIWWHMYAYVSCTLPWKQSIIDKSTRWTSQGWFFHVLIHPPPGVWGFILPTSHSARGPARSHGEGSCSGRSRAFSPAASWRSLGFITFLRTRPPPPPPAPPPPEPQAPEPRAPDISGHCRTSTASSRCQ